MAISYRPEPLPMALQRELQEYLFRELTRISIAVQTISEQNFIIFASAAPTTGTHTLGEIVFNDGTVTTIATVDHWRCTVSGTPGTWITK